MSKFIDKIASVSKLYHATGCAESHILAAQEALGLSFPDEYKEYVKVYGAISFYQTEWTGLNVDGHLNVVNATLQERALNPAFPSDCFVLENHAVDGLFTVVNQEGCVYLLRYDRKEFLCWSLAEYLDFCIARIK